MSDSTNYQYYIDLGKDTCTLPSELTYAEPIVGKLTLKTVMAIVAGILTAITLLLTSINCIRHLRNFTCPQEQRQIVRLIITPFMFSLFYFLSICWYKASYYLEPVATLYEAIGMIALYLLFIAYVVPGSENQTNLDIYFNDLERHKNFRRKKKHDRGSLRWFYVDWILVFQSLILRLGVTLGEWIFWAGACPLDDVPTPLQVIEPIFMAVWAYGLLSFYFRLRPQLKERNAFSKANCFKLIVLLQIIQTPIFDNLLSNGKVTPSSTVSYRDLDVGLPAFIVCCEMVLFSIGFFFAFRTKEYKSSNSNSELEARRLQQPLPVGAAFIYVIDLRDILSGFNWPSKLAVIFGGKRNLPPPKEDAYASSSPNPSYSQGPPPRQYPNGQQNGNMYQQPPPAAYTGQQYGGQSYGARR